MNRVILVLVLLAGTLAGTAALGAARPALPTGAPPAARPVGTGGKIIALKPAGPWDQPGGPAIAPDLRTSIWPAIHPAILDLIKSHHSTIVFTNNRRVAERLTLMPRDLCPTVSVRAR